MSRPLHSPILTAAATCIALAIATVIIACLASGCSPTAGPQPFFGRVCFDLFIPATPAEMPSVCRENGWDACYDGKLNRVWMPGKRSVGEYIYLQDNILGHEVKHVLSRKFPERFENPDRPAWFLENF